MGFQEDIEALKNPPEEGLRETIYDDLTQEYTTLLTGSQENLRRRDEEISARDTQIADLKARNYDLVVQLGSGGDNQGSTGESNENVVPSIEGLFVKKGRP